MPASAAPSAEPLSGRVLLGRYRVVRPLAKGGMGVVYLGRVEGAAGFAKPVVIKTMLADSKGASDGEALFAREARIVSHLQHPGIVAVIDFGRVDAAHVMVLEYVHGYNLGQWFRYVKGVRGDVPIEHAVHVILGVLDALEYAHTLTRPDGTPFGIIHRDISPGNVLIDLQGHVKLADFGIARSAEDEFKTEQGMFRGTLPFSAPEVLHGDPVDGRCDQYASAVLLYYILTGVHPFKGAETAQTITRVLTHTPPPASSIRRDVPAALDAALATAMSKEPANRFSCAAEFAEALRAASYWSEREAALDFAAQIERDFLGNMPTRLELEPLTDRDASWRDAQDTPDPSRVSLSSSPPEMRSVITKRERLVPSDSETLKVPIETVKAGGEARAPRSTSTWLLVIISALAVIAAGAAVAIVLLRPPPEVSHKVLVVEKQSEPESNQPLPGDSSEHALPVQPAPTQEATGVPSTASARPGPTAAKPQPSRGEPLARAFQRQEGAIQRCFQKSPEGLEGTPRLSVKFNVDRDGRVTSAFLDPPSVSGQPLGSCILGVARATNFGPQAEPVSFSIPIAARVVRH